MKNRKTIARLSLCVLSMLLLVTTFIASNLAPVTDSLSAIRRLDGSVNTNIKNYLDSSVAYKLPDTVKSTDEISVIVQVTQKSLLEVYQSTSPDMSFTEFANSDEADAIREQIAAEKAALLSDLEGTELAYTLGADYDAVLGGFEIIIQAADFETMCERFGDRATTIVGEVYNVAETKLVENTVNVYETGIFDSSSFGYDGTGIVVAVLDTGLDYDHSAFSLANFTADRSKLGLTFDEVTACLSQTKASGYHAALTASDVYVNEKVPFAYDYADQDSDVFPLANEHGTHVAGIIAGKDNTITGVAPNAQLVIMKTFSDVKDTARTAWILAALNDCVTLGVDVINMSLGTACGFSREMDKESIDGVYDRVRQAGISMVVAASNSYSSTYGSEKNGNLGLTSNPDTATVGSPGTYEGALSVASIDGAKTPYILYNTTIMYFEESTDRVSEEKNFFEEILPDGTDTMEFEYVTIPGVGRSADYTGIDVTNKIALVRRGSTTFEEKAAVAQQMGAAGMIVYNNVSGEIKMNVGDATIPVCSIRQDDGELLAASATGKIKISRSQTSGPFISSFSSWGPTPDLGIKPEITAHGGMILSAVPGQSYDRISGTSMACPNIAGVSALMRQYVKENFTDIANDSKEVTAKVNRLLMSTADIVINTNGVPYAVRKQGAGLANLTSSAATTAYILTYSRADGSVMDKSKIELGDDPQKTGVYNLKFSIENFGASALSYDLGAYVMTEGVSDTKTNDGKTTVTEQGYILSGASVTIASIEGSTRNGNNLTVAAGETATLTVTITLGADDKAYLDQSFANGMYVEGFITLDATAGTDVDLNVPYLAFYGDWTQAPMFDLDYYATNKDELDDSIDLLDKTLPDAYATRPIGGLSDDYVSYLGSYYFEQDPSATKISADRKYISLSNQDGSVNSLRFVWAGLLRNAKTIEITITEDSTGEVVFSKVENDVRKSYGDGGSIYPANVKIEFNAMEHNLKNNTQYTVKLQGHLDYGDGGVNTNLNNTFEFPLVTDFEAPTVTGCEFYTEYDKSAKKTRLFAKVAVYDNHYSMASLIGYVDETYTMVSFDQYLTPIYSDFNTTSYVVYELTDYIYELKQNALDKQKAGVPDYNYTPAITVACYDYAMNEATYEIPLPAKFTDFYFAEEETGLTLNPNETYTLAPVGYPEGEWSELLIYTSSRSSVARIVNNKIIAVGEGNTVISARDPHTGQTVTYFSLHVRGEGEDGYVKYDKPVAHNFYLSGYYVNKAYYQLSTEERKIGQTGDERKFPSKNSYALSMFPSESVTLRYVLDAYFPDETTVEFASSSTDIVEVTADGTITAKAEGYASISVRVMMNGKATYYSQDISITVKEPYITSGPILSHYFGLGGKVTFPTNLAVTEIGDYAFSNFEYIPKTEEDEISEDEPDLTKIWFIGDDTIEEVIVPEGVEVIGAYAFANLTSLRSVTLPSTLKRIEQGAFFGCVNLREVKGIEHVQLINQNAFNGCNLTGTLRPEKAIAVANYAFAFNKNLKSVILPETTKSVGAYAFAGCTALENVTVNADKIKLGEYAFFACESLTEMSINAAVIPAGTFYACKNLTSVTVGADVAVIGEMAFGRTAIDNLVIHADNTAFRMSSDGNYLLNAAGDTLMLLLPAYEGKFTLNDSNITTVAAGAVSGNTALTAVELPYTKYVGDFAFADCIALKTAILQSPETIGDYAFYNTALTEAPSFANLREIGDYAFAYTRLSEVVIPDNVTVGSAAFTECARLENIVIGNGVILGENAFRRDNLSHIDLETSVGSYYYGDNTYKTYYIIYDSPIHSLTIGDNVVIGNAAFYGAAELQSVTMGQGVVIGDYAFYNNCSLTDIDLSGVKSIGAAAFSGDMLYEFLDPELTVYAVEDDYYIYRYYASRLSDVRLNAVTELGEEAFALCQELTSVTLGAGLTEIPARAFQMCKNLRSVNLESVQTIGDYAFYETDLGGSLSLTAAEKIGAYAFSYNVNLTAVSFGNAETIALGEAAFAYCENLNRANLNRVTHLGDYSLAYTAITEADLQNAVSIGTQVFLKEDVTDFALTLGDRIAYMGDNPFAMCHLAPFSSTVVESFNGKDYPSVTYTYKINDHIQIIDGSIYRVVPNGYELIAFAGTDRNVTLPEGTVRISAMAFAGSDATNVILPKTLRAIGHKAFFACNSLNTVTFTSYEAPILEEEYDESYYGSLEHIPATGDYEFTDYKDDQIVFHGIEIVPYFMWNAASNPSNVYYGATFVDYIGYNDKSLVMIKPVNGQHYDTFIMDQYFGTSVSGAAAADAITQAAIDAINRIPEKLTLDDKALVVAARAAYDLITSLEQRALVTNYLRLTQAENTIADLEYIQQPATPDTPSTPDDTVDGKKLTTMEIVCIALGAALVVMTVLMIVFAVKAGKGGNGDKDSKGKKREKQQTRTQPKRKTVAPTPQQQQIVNELKRSLNKEIQKSGKKPERA